ncbi:MAG: hypothetical protein JWM75_2119 [Sphingomonas bacterium]|nr:hypothetical protein [Sphingomonas bacterium]
MSALQIRVVLLGSLATFLDGYDIQALGLAIPGMAKSFAVAPTAFAPALSLTLLGIGLGAVVFGSLADRHGRRPILIATMLLIAATMLAAMFAPSPAMLAVARLFTGLGIGGAVPVAVAMTAEYVPLRRRALIVTVTIACVALGSFAAGFVAPLLESRWGWRGIFAVGAAMPLAMAAMLWAAYPESIRLLLLGGRKPAEVRRQMDLIAPARAHLTPFVAPPSFAGRPSVRALFGAVHGRRTTLLWIILWFNLFTAYSLIGWLPTLLGSAGWERADAQRVTGILALGSIVGGLSIAWIADRGHSTLPMLMAYLVAAILFGAFLVVPPNVPIWFTMLAVAGLGVFGAQTALVSIAAAFYYPPELCSTGVGWFNAIGRTGAVVGPLLVAALIDANWAAAPILAVLGVPMLICVMGVALLPRALRTPPQMLE